MEDDTLNDAPIAPMKKYNDWVKKNIFTMIGIIIIMVMVLFEMTTVETQKIAVANKCNEYWLENLERTCPILFESGDKFDIETSGLINIDLSNDSAIMKNENAD